MLVRTAYEEKGLFSLTVSEVFVCGVPIYGFWAMVRLNIQAVEVSSPHGGSREGHQGSNW